MAKGVRCKGYSSGLYNFFKSEFYVKIIISDTRLMGKMAIKYSLKPESSIYLVYLIDLPVFRQRGL